MESIIQNLPATVQNVNYEFSIRTENIESKQLRWNTFFNITFPFNKVVSFPGIENTVYWAQTDIVVIGQPLGTAGLYKYSGVDPETGQYLVFNRDGKTTASPDYNADRKVFINPLPRFYGGFQNSISFKRFDLDVLFRFTKQKAPSFTDLFSSILPGHFEQHASIGNQSTNILSRWKKPGDIAQYQKFTAIPYASNIKSISDGAYIDASFLRLQNVSISWQAPDAWVRKMNLQRCRIYAQAQNIFTVTNYDGLDPEVQSGFMPPLKTLTIGLQVAL